MVPALELALLQLELGRQGPQVAHRLMNATSISVDNIAPTFVSVDHRKGCGYCAIPA